MNYEITVEEIIKKEKAMREIAKWQQIVMVIFGITVMLTIGYREGLAQTKHFEEVSVDAANFTMEETKELNHEVY